MTLPVADRTGAESDQGRQVSNLARVLASRVLALIVLGLWSTVGVPESAAHGSDVDGRGIDYSPDVLWYAAGLRVGLDEAERRFALMREAGALNAILYEHEDSYGGMWIEHDPFQVEVRMAAGTAGSIDRYEVSGELSSVLHVAERDVTLKELESEQDQLSLVLPEGADFGSDLIVSQGIIEVALYDVMDSSTIVDLELPPHVIVETDAPPVVAATPIYGGLPLSNGCTSGFSVDELDSSREGISTAGHCGTSISWGGTDLPLQAVVYCCRNDLQWHTTPGINDPNKFYSGIDTRFVYGRVPRLEQVEGTIVCKYGRNGGYGCATVVTNSDDPPDSCVPNSSSTWIVADSVTGKPIAEQGDSGGPVFRLNDAYGSFSCLSPPVHGTRIVYMAANMFRDLGVEIALQS